MNKCLGAIAAIILVVNQFFAYPILADESTKNNSASEQVQVDHANAADQECCVSETNSVEISDNGENSENSINYSKDTGTTVNQSNNLNITNNFYITANTGDNKASDNEGRVEIITGEVNLSAQVLNQNLNLNNVKTSGNNSYAQATVSENGANSTNSINESLDEDDRYSTTNSILLTNSLDIKMNTGDNKANKNSGKVFISTGSITLDIILTNQINQNKIVSSCCKDLAQASLTPTPSSTPDADTLSSSTPQGSCCSPTTDIPGPGGSGGSSGSSASSGEVLGASLPATGGFSVLSLTALALLMLISGVILRSDFSYGQTKFKKIFGEFVNSLRNFAFGAYLFANIKGLSAYKT